jgi:tetratricopeptide (TPR) repeat protein/CHAT domain-containing protein
MYHATAKSNYENPGVRVGTNVLGDLGERHDVGVRLFGGWLQAAASSPAPLVSPAPLHFHNIIRVDHWDFAHGHNPRGCQASGVRLLWCAMLSYACSLRIGGGDMGFIRNASLLAGLLAFISVIVHCVPAVAQERPAEFEEMYQRGLAFYQAGKYPEATAVAQQFIKLAAARYGEQHPLYATGLFYLAALYQAQDRAAEAETLFKRALAIKEKALGPDHAELADIAINLADLYQKQGRFPEAEHLLKRVLTIHEKTFGPDHAEVADALLALAEVYRKQGRASEADLMTKRSRGISAFTEMKALGAEHPKRAQEDPAALEAEATKLYHAGKYVEAIEVAKQLLTINERLGPNHPSVAATLNGLGLFYAEQGRYAEAEPVFKRSIVISEQVHGPEHQLVGTAINNLAQLYQAQARFDEAEPLFKRSLAIFEKVLGSEDQAVGMAINNLAQLYQSQGRYAEAELLSKRSLVIFEKALGLEHRSVGLSINNLALLYQVQGRYNEAEPLFGRSLTIYEKALGPEHPDLTRPLNNLALLHVMMGQYAKAEPLYRRAIAIAEKALGPDHATVATLQNNLAELYQAQARYAEAESLHKRSLVVFEKALGPDHPNVGTPLNDLAFLYQTLGRYAEAEPLYERSLTVAEKALGPDHLSVGMLVSNLGMIRQLKGHYTDAERLFTRGLVIREKALGPDHAQVAQSLTHLAMLHHAQGRFADAEPLYKRSLSIREKALGVDHAEFGQSLNNLGLLYQIQERFAEAEPLYQRGLAILEKARGTDHPEVAQSLSNLALLAYIQQDWLRAADYWRRSGDIIQRLIERGLDIGPVRTPGWLPSLGLVKSTYHLMVQRSKPSATLGAETFEAAQWARGSEAAASLSQMAARTAKGSPQLTGVVREQQDLLSERRAKDKQLIAARSKSREERRADTEKALSDRLEAIDSRLAEISKMLANYFPDYAAFSSPKPISVTEVQAQLNANEALVLLLDMPEENPLPGRRPVPEETFIWVVSKSGHRWVRSELGTVALAREVTALRCGLDRTTWYGNGTEKCLAFLSVSVGEVPGPSDPLPFDHARAHKIYSALFHEVQDLIKGKHLLIVPSGPLTQLPFQVLVTKPPSDHRAVAWLAREHAITILPAVSSLKALRQIGKPSTASRPMIGFGNPLLDGTNGARAKLALDKQRCPDGRWPRIAERGGGRAGVTSIETRGGLADVAYIKSLEPLPETADELCAVAGEVKAQARDIYLGAQATEREIKRLSANGELAKYQTIHFATHGALAGELRGSHEPGLILTPPDKPTEEDDGYLSASEIAALKLDADWVIMSACNTAAGSATSADALSGLARAFIYAQARALLVSHWEVYSDATVKLITTALREIARDPKVGRAEAIRRSMLALIDKGEPHEAHPAYWAPFVVVGEGSAPQALKAAATKRTARKSTSGKQADWTTEFWKGQ